MAKSADRVKQKFQQRVSGAAGEYAAGVNEPSKPWLDSYKKASDRMKQETQAALNEGRHIKGAEAAGDAKWKDRAQTVGANRYSAAAADAAEKYGEVVSDVLAAGDAGQKAAQAKPDTTIDQRLERAKASALAISEFWRRKKGFGTRGGG